MESSKVLLLVETAVAVALAYVLGMIKLFQMPYGGSISLEMLPILVLAFRRGAPTAILAGLVYGLLNLMLDGLQWIVHPLQLILDYPLPFALLGIAGFWPRHPYLGTIAGTFGRFLSHFISGFVFWGAYGAEYGLSPVAYSFFYNILYVGPELIIAILLVKLLLSRKDFFFPDID